MCLSCIWFVFAAFAFLSMTSSKHTDNSSDGIHWLYVDTELIDGFLFKSIFKVYSFIQLSALRRL